MVGSNSVLIDERKRMTASLREKRICRQVSFAMHLPRWYGKIFAKDCCAGWVMDANPGALSAPLKVKNGRNDAVVRYVYRDAANRQWRNAHVR